MNSLDFVQWYMDGKFGVNTWGTFKKRLLDYDSDVSNDEIPQKEIDILHKDIRAYSKRLLSSKI